MLMQIYFVSVQRNDNVWCVVDDRDIKGGEANFSFCDFEPNFLHEFLPKS